MHPNALPCLAVALGATAAALASPVLHRTGTPGPDVLRGTPSDDGLDGRGGADVLLGYGGRDRLVGGQGKDTLVGGLGGDLLIAGASGDRIDGRDSRGPHCMPRLRRLSTAGDYPSCTDIVVAGAGDDTILIQDRRLDVIGFCGGGETLSSPIAGTSWRVL